MNIKKRLKRFFTLTRRPNGGFTLVELIVVIAILAILAGVGGVGYSGYIKSTNRKTDVTTVRHMVRALQTANNSGALSFIVQNQYAAGLKIPVGFIVVSNENIGDTGHSVVTLSPGTASYDETTGKYVNSGVGINDSESVLGKAVELAFGDTYTEIKLRSGDWDSNMNGGFFSNAEGMVEAVRIMGDSVMGYLEKVGEWNVLGSGLFYNDGAVQFKFLGREVTSKKIISKDYQDSAELLLDFSKKVSLVPRDQFIDHWDNVSTPGDAFGVNLVSGAGREHYSAARAAYNNCFASFLEEESGTITVDGTEYTHNTAEHAAAIRDYGESAADLLEQELGDIGKYLGDEDINFPQAVCASVLTGSGDVSAIETCPVCRAHYDTYKSSEQDRDDAANFYDTMVTGSQEGEEAYDAGNPDAFFSWMKANAATFADLYEEVDDLVGDKSAVVIAVYYENGILLFETAPSTILTE